jgi:hypothetical protein
MSSYKNRPFKKLALRGLSGFAHLIFLSLFLAPQALPDTVLFPPNVVDVLISGPANDCPTFGVGTAASCSSYGAFAQAIATNGTGGFVTATSGPYSLTATAELVYFFDVTGPTSTSVPIIFGGTSTETYSAGYMYSEAYIYTVSATGTDNPVLDLYPTNNTALCSEVSDPIATCAPAGAFSANLIVATNTLYYVSLRATAALGTETIDDSTIAIDPSFNQANQFNLVASPGVFGSSVPEPTSFQLSFVLCAAFAVVLVKDRKSSIVFQHL